MLNNASDTFTYRVKFDEFTKIKLVKKMFTCLLQLLILFRHLCFNYEFSNWSITTLHQSLSVCYYTTDVPNKFCNNTPVHNLALKY